MKYLTRGELANFLSAAMSTRTVKSDYLAGTIFEDWELTDNWLVVFMENDKSGVFNIECVPEEYVF